MNIRIKSFLLFLVFSMLMFPLSAFAHEVSWPGKRLNKLLPEASNFKQKQKPLTSGQISELERTHKVKIGVEDRSPIFYLAYGEKDPDTGRPPLLGIAVFIDVAGEYGPIELSVLMDKKGSVLKASVWSQKDTRKIQNEDFLNQFVGKTSKDAFKVGEDIEPAVKAEKSSQAVAKGVKKAILLMHTVFKRH